MARTGRDGLSSPVDRSGACTTSRAGGVYRRRSSRLMPADKRVERRDHMASEEALCRLSMKAWRCDVTADTLVDDENDPGGDHTKAGPTGADSRALWSRSSLQERVRGQSHRLSVQQWHGTHPAK